MLSSPKAPTSSSSVSSTSTPLPSLSNSPTSSPSLSVTTSAPVEYFFEQSTHNSLDVIPFLDELDRHPGHQIDSFDNKITATTSETPVAALTPPLSPLLSVEPIHDHNKDLEQLDFEILFSPAPSTGLQHTSTPTALSKESIGLPSAIPSRLTATPSPVASLPERRSRIPSFFLRFASKQQAQKFDLTTTHSNKSSLSFSSSPKVSKTATAASDCCTRYTSTTLPRGKCFDRGLSLHNVVSSAHVPAAQPPTKTHILIRSPSIISSSNSTFSKRPNSLRRFNSRRSSSDSHPNHKHLSPNFPVIFRSTAACRLSIPINALRSLQTISEHDISRKMHQTSSRLLRMTEDERPYTRDFKDLFSTLMVSLPLTPHRVRFQRIDHTFTSEEAITNLGSLKFSQSNRMPDPKDPSRIVTTTTTTTFSMAREMAKSVCQKFLEARFVESVDGKNDFSSKSAVWQLTPKGMHILQRFCNRNGINQRHVQLLLESPRNTMHLVILERESDGDRIYRDQATIEVIFRRFVGQDGPNLKWSTANSDSDSVTDYQTGLIGVKMARERKIGDKTYWNTFTGKAAVDWLMDCCTMVDRRETVELAGLFVDAGLIHPVEGTVQPGKFSPSKTSIYYVTDRGQKVAGWIPSVPLSRGSGNDAAPQPRRTDGANRDSNANRMTVIIRDPALRLLFREFLRDTHCEENLAFYLDVKEFLTAYNVAKRAASSSLRLDTIRETLAAAYSLYNAFLAPGSPCELNIDHSLRTALAGRMTRAVGDDEATITSLDEVAGLFDQAQTSVFKLMASDSVPKFMREPKYVPIIRERNLDVIIGGLNAAAPRA